MKMLTGIILLMALTASLATANEQVMICKPVKSVFGVPKSGSHTILGNSQRPKPSPGPRGRPGPRGKPGMVDEKTLDAKIEEKLSKIEERIARLEALSTREVKQDHDKTVQRPCPISHRDKCFEFVSEDGGLIKLDAAKKKCQELRGELANVYDSSHLRKIENYARELMGDDEITYFLAGMEYNSKGVTLNNGRTAGFTQWITLSYPFKQPGLSQIHVQIYKDPGKPSGMYNTSPFTAAKSALCEMPKRYYD